MFKKLMGRQTAEAADTHVRAGSANGFSVKNPASGETIATVPNMTRADLDAVVERAQEAFMEWSARSPEDRAALCGQIAKLIEENLGPPPLTWSTVMFRKTEGQDGYEAAQARRDCHEAAAG